MKGLLIPVDGFPEVVEHDTWDPWARQELVGHAAREWKLEEMALFGGALDLMDPLNGRASLLVRSSVYGPALLLPRDRTRDDEGLTARQILSLCARLEAMDRPWV